MRVGNGIEPPTYGFSDRRSTTELPKINDEMSEIWYKD